MATLYWKLYKGLKKDGKGNLMQIPVGEVGRGKVTIPDSATSTGVAIADIDHRATVVKLKADADCQYYLTSPVKTADGNADLLFVGETEYESIEQSKNETWGLSVITKQ